MHSSRIPKTLQAELVRHAHKIAEYWMEEDEFEPELGSWSIWIYLTPDYENGYDPGLGCIHEATAKDAIAALRMTQPTTVPR
jgi:hypothetical protein